jgi:anti-sigma factor RsiW
MNCSDFVTWIARKVEGSLTPEQLTELDSHLSVCSQCRAELILQKKIAASLKQEPLATLPADFAERVSSLAFHTAKQDERSYRVRFLAPLVAATLIAVVTFLLRGEIAQVVPTGSQAATDALTPPLAWAGRWFLNLLAKLPVVASEEISGLEWIQGMLMNTVVMVGIALAVLLWAFRRALVFMRE